MAAVRTILIADLVMSLDNVIAVAAAAKGSMMLLILGLAISIPLVIFGSTLMIKLMERFPIIIMLGAALLGWVGGETIVSDVDRCATCWRPTPGCTTPARRPAPSSSWPSASWLQRRAATAAH